MSKDVMSFKARIRNLAKERNINAQVLMQNFMFERLLERLSLSEYKDKFIIKGGALIAAIVGIDTRSTMDLDATFKGLPFTEETIRHAMSTVCLMPINDGVKLTVGTIAPIRPDDVYGGYSVKITAIYDTVEVPFSVDISTGDVITPHPIEYVFHCLFDDDKQINLWAYNMETILAEKIETVLRRNILNTRARDFYDIFILIRTQPYNKTILKEAFAATSEHRHTTEQVSNIHSILKLIEDNAELKQMWEKYRKDFSYATNITYEQVCEAIKYVCEALL